MLLPPVPSLLPALCVRSCSTVTPPPHLFPAWWASLPPPTSWQGCRVGGQVGFKVRFNDTTSPSTRIKYMTDGTLVRETLTDELLAPYSVIMLDEAHERSVHTGPSRARAPVTQCPQPVTAPCWDRVVGPDVLFGLLKKVLEKRPELRVVVTSATLNTDKFAAYFGECPTFEVPGRSFDVDIFHSKVDIKKTGA